VTPWAQKKRERQAAGLCRACGGSQAPGRALCEYHLARERDRKRAKDAKRKAEGLCVEAGCGRGAEIGKWTVLYRYRDANKGPGAWWVCRCDPARSGARVSDRDFRVTPTAGVT
jgi:hypothetical protein